MMNLTPRVERLVRWLAAGNGYLEAVVVRPGERAFRKRFHELKGRPPIHGRDYTVARNARIKGGKELRLVIPVANERYRSILEDDLALAPLRATPDGKGWRKSIGRGEDNLFYDLLSLGFECGRARHTPHRLNRARVHRLVRDSADEKRKLREFLDGSKREITHEMPVRNVSLIQAAKGHYPTICCVCGFDFGETYGHRGAGYIEAHHLKPVAFYQRLGQKVTVKDIRLVCANCHRMLHRGVRLLSIVELKRIVDQHRRNARRPR